ncbi:hypothetical protein [Pectinatus frisingensis]|uniref:hypothetical protein n=1 Tax=Pectinatus frisingensis TaxID=865 RepID=UPI0018C7CC0F|nr:hypothetical protein [Pectinatus frisingensis]
MNGIRKFLLGDINVVDLGDGVILSKESTKTSELWHISVDGKDKKTFWVSKKNNQSKKGNYTGGKAAYLMLMEKPVYDLISSNNYYGNIYIQLGFLQAMSGHIEFKTGRLIDKYKKPLSRTDLINITKFSHNKIDKLLKDMKSNGLLEHNSEGYFISRKFIKKGAKQ